MSKPERSSWEAETELIPTQSGEASPQTLELPVVPAEDQADAASPTPTAAAPPPATASPTPTAAAPPQPAPSPVVAAPQPVEPPRPSPAPSPGGVGRRSLQPIIVILALIAVIALAGLAWTALSGRGAGPTATSDGAKAAAGKVEANVSSFDPSGGTGFRERGDSWRTQTYTTAQFGNLKPGVGLLLDVGEARAVSSVDFAVANGPITVELRAADEKAADASGYANVGEAKEASGSTTLRGEGKHRYWLVWVTRLAPQNGGYGAEISKINVNGG